MALLQELFRKAEQLKNQEHLPHLQVCFPNIDTGPPCPHQPVTMDKINPKDCQVKKPLVIQGFSNVLGLFQVIMANPVDK